MSDGPDLHLVHRIDQSQAEALTQINNLVNLIIESQQDRPPEETPEDDPMVYIAVVQILHDKISIEEYPYLLAGAVLQLVKHTLKCHRPL